MAKNGLKISELESDIICNESDIRTLINMKKVTSVKPLIINVYPTNGSSPTGLVNVRTIEEGCMGGKCKVEIPIVSEGYKLTLTYHKEICTCEGGTKLYPPYFRIASYKKKGE